MKELKAKDYLLSVQHLFAMFGATILVPLITGMNPSLALFSAGVGTLMFHVCTKFEVPVFLGSSFAFLGAISAVVGGSATQAEGVALAQGGIIGAGLIYLLFALIAYLIGAETVKRIFPPIVTGPIIVIIGINLASTAVKDAFNIGTDEAFAEFTARGINSQTGLNILIALFTLAVVVLCSVRAKRGIFKLIPVLIGIVFGYVLCVILNLFGVFDMDFSAIRNASWINIPFLTKDANGVPFMSLPKFDWGVVLSIAPIAIVTFMEHIGDITTNGTVVGKNFLDKPGLHRTLLGDGLATLFAGLVGGPPNTTYSENTGVLATTKNYNPLLLRITAVFAIILGLFGKVGAVLQTIPAPVKGGVELVLFGMIASVGIRSLAEAKLDFSQNRTTMIIGLTLVVGLGVGGIGGINCLIGDFSLNLSGLFVAVVVGVILNLILPESKTKEN